MVLFMDRSEVGFMHHMKVPVNGFFVIEYFAAFWAHVLAFFCFSGAFAVWLLGSNIQLLKGKEKSYQKTVLLKFKC